MSMNTVNAMSNNPLIKLTFVTMRLSFKSEELIRLEGKPAAFLSNFTLYHGHYKKETV